MVASANQTSFSAISGATVSLRSEIAFEASFLIVLRRCAGRLAR